MRRSQREVAAQPIPLRLRNLFHEPSGEQHVPKKLELLHEGPNVYFVRDFLTPSEISYFDKVCTLHGKAFKSSFTEDDEKHEIVSEERTSSHIHLTKGQHAMIRSVERRAADLVGLTSQAVEPLQIVSYTRGQKFNTHHDAGTLLDDGSVDLVLPRRLVTFFVYLNNLPPDQGHTAFPALDISVQPVKGCAVLFCNVLPDGSPDKRTIHCAEPVLGNLRKYGVNIWLCDCDMQELAQVKANCVVSSEAVINDDISALLKAERLTRKYVAENAVRSNAAFERAVRHSSPSNSYWSADVVGYRSGVKKTIRLTLNMSQQLDDSSAHQSIVMDNNTSVTKKAPKKQQSTVVCINGDDDEHGSSNVKRVKSTDEYWSRESSSSNLSAEAEDAEASVKAVKR